MPRAMRRRKAARNKILIAVVPAGTTTGAVPAANRNSPTRVANKVSVNKAVPASNRGGPHGPTKAAVVRRKSPCRLPLAS